MPTPASGSTTPEAEPEFNIDTALNTRGFAEFLALYPDGETIVNDKEELEKRFRVFEKKDQLGKDLKDLYRKEIQEKTGFRLTDTEMEHVEDLLGKEALRDPERFLEISELTEEFRHNGTAIVELENIIREQGGEAGIAAKLAELENDKWSLMGARSTLGTQVLKSRVQSWWEQTKAFITQSGEKGLATTALEQRTQAKEKFDIKGTLGMLSQGKIEARIQEIERKIQQIQEVTDAQAAAGVEYSRAKAELLNDFLPIAEVIATARKKVGDRLTELYTNVESAFSFENADEAYAFVEKMKEASASGSADYLEGHNIDDFVNNLDATIEAKVVEQVTKAMNEVVLASGSLASMERALEKFGAREKIGSKEGDDVRVFLQETLTKAAADPKMGQPKKILITRLIAKLNS